MVDFEKFLKENHDKIWRIAYANSKHDKDGHCLLSKNDPWIKEDCWDRYFERLAAADNKEKK